MSIHPDEFSEDLIWATPTIVTPDNWQEVQFEDNLVARSIATNKLNKNELTIPEFLDYLSGLGYDPEDYLELVEHRLNDLYRQGRIWL